MAMNDLNTQTRRKVTIEEIQIERLYKECISRKEKLRKLKHWQRVVVSLMGLFTI
jgi:hypothetical protein